MAHRTKEMEAVLDVADEAALGAWAQHFISLLQPGDVLALAGGLGAGKTAFARALIRAALKGDSGEDSGETIFVPSPTYSLVQIYETPEITFWHADLFRIEGVEELMELGLEAAEAGVLLVEWPEKWGAGLPHHRLHIRFVITGAKRRTLHLRALGEHWRARLPLLCKGGNSAHG